jgi:uncharacterized heparinase superfamily protein
VTPPLRKQIKTRSLPGSIMRLRGSLFRWRLARARSRLGRFRFRASRFLFVPPHLHLADPSVAADFMAGQIVLAGRSLLTGGRSVFDLAMPSLNFAIALNGFDWLRHFDATGSTQIRAGAKQIVAQWMDRREAGSLPIAEMPACVPRRVIAWVTHSALLAEGVDFATYRRLLDHLARDAAMLRLMAASRATGMLRLESAIALLFHALALNRRKADIVDAESQLLTACRSCIAPDGGPANRDAGTAVRVAADLIPLLALYRARQRATPEVLGPLLLRLISFIRMMQQPDGGLALFSNAGLVMRDLVAQVTQFGKGQAARLESARETGYERLEDEHGIVIADAGRLPEPVFATAAGASALAFEFSTKADRIIVNCGMPPSAQGESRESFRHGAAYSTVLIDNEALVRLEPCQSIFSDTELCPASDSDAVPPGRISGTERETLVLAHKGPAASGVEIERRLTLLSDGGGLAGADRILAISSPEQSHRVTLAFHLHPRVLAVPLSRQDGIVLRLPHQTPGRDMWLFEAPGIPLQLEASLCYEQEITSPKTEAIVLEVVAAGQTEIAWRIVPYRA